MPNAGLTFDYIKSYFVARPEFQYDLNKNIHSRNTSEIIIPFYSNSVLSKSNCDVTNTDGISVKNRDGMDIINSTTKMTMHGQVVSIPGQAFKWNFRNASLISQTFILSIWNKNGISNFTFHLFLNGQDFDGMYKVYIVTKTS